MAFSTKGLVYALDTAGEVTKVGVELQGFIF